MKVEFGIRDICESTSVCIEPGVAWSLTLSSSPQVIVFAPNFMLTRARFVFMGQGIRRNMI